uniref:ADAMTS cysteine-rich domain-containing protein n=1 Tax=Megaselia scalaris TaxID=36166 RepID=T1GA11_MEGSC
MPSVQALLWSLVSSSECSASCGGIGTRENSFQCIQTFSNNSQLIIDNNFCADIQYQQFEKCESDGCWEYSEWSQCNASCGPGVQTREVQCKKLGRVLTGSIVNQKKN